MANDNVPAILRAADLLWSFRQLDEAGPAEPTPRPTSIHDARYALGLNHPILCSYNDLPEALDLVGVVFLSGVSSRFGAALAERPDCHWFCVQGDRQTWPVSDELSFFLFGPVLVRVDLDIPEYEGDDHDCEATVQFFAVRPGHESQARTFAESSCDALLVSAATDSINRLRHPASAGAIQAALASAVDRLGP